MKKFLGQHYERAFGEDGEPDGQQLVDDIQRTLRINSIETVTLKAVDSYGKPHYGKTNGPLNGYWKADIAAKGEPKKKNNALRQLRLRNMLIHCPYQTTNSNRVDQYFIGPRRLSFIYHVHDVGNHNHSCCHPMVERTDETNERNAFNIRRLITQKNHTVRSTPNDLPRSALMRGTAINSPAKIRKNLSEGFRKRRRVYYEYRSHKK
jgi:hypothetical protein